MHEHNIRVYMEKYKKEKKAEIRNDKNIRIDIPMYHLRLKYAKIR